MSAMSKVRTLREKAEREALECLVRVRRDYKKARSVRVATLVERWIDRADRYRCVRAHCVLREFPPRRERDSAALWAMAAGTHQYPLRPTK
jgi:hypothetical protein